MARRQTSEGTPTLRQALRRAKALGLQVGNNRGTGEVRIKLDGVGTVNHNARRKDASRAPPSPHSGRREEPHARRASVWSGRRVPAGCCEAIGVRDPGSHLRAPRSPCSPRRLTVARCPDPRQSHLVPTGKREHEMQIRTDKTELSVDAVVQGYVRQSIAPKPEYQRGRAWGERQQQLLVDSILRGYPLPSERALRYALNGGEDAAPGCAGLPARNCPDYGRSVSGGVADPSRYRNTVAVAHPFPAQLGGAKNCVRFSASAASTELRVTPYQVCPGSRVVTATSCARVALKASTHIWSPW